MSDYNIKCTIRNARILRALNEAGYKSQAQFARENNICQMQLNALVAFRLSPVNESTGKLRNTAQDICDALCKLPEDLWTEEQLYLKVMRNSAEFEVSSEEVRAGILEKQFLVGKLLEKLSSRESSVLRSRFYEEETLEVVADRFNVGRERIRQIEQKGLRKLRRLIRSKDCIREIYCQNER